MENRTFERDDLLGKNANRRTGKDQEDQRFERKREEDLDDCL